MNTDVNEARKFYNELHSVIRRWINEGDKLTTFEVLGALDAVKGDVRDHLKEHNETEAED